MDLGRTPQALEIQVHESVLPGEGGIPGDEVSSHALDLHRGANQFNHSIYQSYPGSPGLSSEYGKLFESIKII